MRGCWMNMVWHELEIGVEPNAREAVEYALMEAGALGTVTTDNTDEFRIKDSDQSFSV